jgi:hypothetical protein
MHRTRLLAPSSPSKNSTAIPSALNDLQRDPDIQRAWLMIHSSSFFSSYYVHTVGIVQGNVRPPTVTFLHNSQFPWCQHYSSLLSSSSRGIHARIGRWLHTRKRPAPLPLPSFITHNSLGASTTVVYYSSSRGIHARIGRWLHRYFRYLLATGT